MAFVCQWGAYCGRVDARGCGGRAAPYRGGRHLGGIAYQTRVGLPLRDSFRGPASSATLRAVSLPLEPSAQPSFEAPELAFAVSASSPPLDALVDDGRGSPLLRMLLKARDVDDGDLEAWLEPRLARLRPPDGLAGFDAALDLLMWAHAGNKRIGVFGDYDADGVSSASLLSLYLEAIGCDVVTRVASRHMGYGLTHEVAERMREAGVQLLVTADLGTSDHETLRVLAAHGVRRARAAGWGRGDAGVEGSSGPGGSHERRGLWPQRPRAWCTRAWAGT